MTRLTVNQPAGPGEVFAPDAFDSQVGKTVPLHIPGTPDGTATIMAAQVSALGDSVSLTLEIEPPQEEA